MTESHSDIASSVSSEGVDMNKVDKHIRAENAGWTFANIADGFEDHIQKSVPSYDEWQNLICTLSDFFLPPGPSLVYELGTATGRLSRKLLEHHKQRHQLRVVAIDNVESMIDKARSLAGGDGRIQYVHSDVASFELEPCSLVLSYYTMQFVHPHFRQNVFNRIYQSLNWGGALIIFEKVRAPDARFQDIMMQTYIDFKLANDFSEEEIVQKSRSLKGIQEPFSTQ